MVLQVLDKPDEKRWKPNDESRAHTTTSGERISEKTAFSESIKQNVKTPLSNQL